MKRLFLFVFLGLTSLSALASPQIQHWTMANGARVYFVPAAEIPMVDIRVIFDAAGSRDGDQGGLARLTFGLLNEGAGGLSATQLTERMDNLGVQMELDSARDMAWIGMRSLTRKDVLNAAADTLALMINKPDFPQDAFERIRKHTLLGLRYEAQNASTRGSNRFYSTVYKQHPYSQNKNGSNESLSQLTPADSKDFAQRYMVGSNAIVAIVGDLNRSEAEALAMTVVGELPPGQRPLPIAPPSLLEKAENIHLAHPGKQTSITMGQPGLRRGDKDYFALYLGNQILGGGGLVSRLSDEVREKRGLSYSVGSGFIPMRVEGPFRISAQTRNDQVDEALEVIRATLDNFIKNGPTADELDAVKRNITGGFPLRIASNNKILNYIAMIGFYNLPLDYLDHFNAQIEAVTAAQIRDAFARRIHPESMVTVLVGGDGQAH